MKKIRIKMDETMAARLAVKWMVLYSIFALAFLMMLVASVFLLDRMTSSYLVEGCLGFVLSVWFFISYILKACDEFRFLKGGCKVED